MQNVLYLDHTAKLGGGEIALLLLVDALDKKRFRPIVLLASDGPLVSRLQTAQIETHVMSLSQTIVETRKDGLGINSLLRIRAGMELFRYSFRIARWARKRKIDLIHTNSLKADIYGGLAGRLARIPVIWHIRDHIDSGYLPPAVAGAFRLLAAIIPNVVVTNSKSTLAHLRRPAASTGNDRRKQRRKSFAAVIYDGCAVHRPVPLSVGDVSRSPVVASIGRISHWKGQHVFLQAARQVLERRPETHFWVVGSALFGEESYERELHALARDLKIDDHVRFLGFQDDMEQVLSKIDIVVHSSVLPEPFGQVIIEGMAAGKSVVATDGGAVPEIVIPGKTGVVVPMGDPEKMADAIVDLLEAPERARAMGLAGRARVEECFNIALTAENVATLYERVLCES